MSWTDRVYFYNRCQIGKQLIFFSNDFFFELLYDVFCLECLRFLSWIDESK